MIWNLSFTYYGPCSQHDLSRQHVAVSNTQTYLAGGSRSPASTECSSLLQVSSMWVERGQRNWILNVYRSHFGWWTSYADILVRAIAVVVVQSVQTPPFAVAYNGFSPPRHGGTCRGHVPIDVTMHFRQRLWKKPRQYSRSRYQTSESATRQGASDWLATASSSI